MKTKRILPMLVCMFVFLLNLFAVEANSERQQTDVKKKEIVYRWQTNPEEFAKFFFGDDLSVRSPRKEPTIFREKAKEIVGNYVEWTVKFGISPTWLIMPKEMQKKSTRGNPGIYYLIGPELSGWMELASGSRLEGTQKITWEQMTWGMPPQCDVRLKMKIDGVLAMILLNGMLHIGVEGSELEIQTTSKRCDWPAYKNGLSDTLLSRLASPALPNQGNEIRVTNAYKFPVKVGLRSGDNGIDFIVPANGSASTSVPGAKYSIYFQYGADPESLYLGDELDVRSMGIEIKLKESGDYKIRKVK
jgi:hypothetical protein